jgi:probable F420-dependent oxidoreductase
MKFGLMFANAGPFGQPEMLTLLAQTAEQVGIESLWTVEHVVVPVGYESQYPYGKDGKMPGPEEAPIPDPFVWLSYAAAVTSEIKLATGVLILPQRHPFYVAKEVASLDQLSRGRVILGIGIGWLEEEFAALDVPFRTRAARTEESVAALRELWGEGATAHSGAHFSWDEVHSNPKPVQPGGPPIVVGGHVPGAARRAARVGDGFFPARGDLPELFAAMREECDRIGRDPGEIELTTGGLPTPDEVRKAEDLGVSRYILMPPAFDPDGLRKGLEQLGDELISKA